MLKNLNRRQWLLIISLCVITLSLGNTRSALAQDVVAEEYIGRIKPPTLRIGSGRRGKSAPRPRRPATYRPDKPIVKAPPPPAMEYSQVGVTVYRVKEGSKELGQELDEALEQLASNTPLSIGSKVRIAIEPLTRDGYLYVINREQFADGSYGTPRLIFPTLRTRQGINAVKVSQLIYIPMPPSYFVINPSSTGKTQTAEVLTILLSPTPLELPGPLTEKPLVLSAEMVQRWEKLWGTQGNRLELNGGAGQTTSAKAQTERSKELDMVGDESTPLPQTVFRAAIKVGDPFLITLPLTFR